MFQISASLFGAKSKIFTLAVCGACGFLILSQPATAQAQSNATRLDQFLSVGQVDQAVKHFQSALQQQPADSQAGLALGFSQFLQAIQRVAQANNRFGILNNPLVRQLPIARMPVPENKEPELVTYEDVRDVLRKFADDLAAADQTLAAINTDKLQPLDLYLGRIQLDLDGNGALAEDETFWRILSVADNQITEEQGKNFVLGGDGADVHWLRGYLNFLMAFCKVALAYDERDLFERCGHLVFPRIRTPFLVPQQAPPDPESFDFGRIADAIAAIHLINFKLQDKQKMAEAHDHLLTMIKESRRCWKQALAETDNHHEWMPNPQQTGVLGTPVSQDIITAWSKVLDEIEAILVGQKLIPYWRDYVGNPLGFGPAREVPQNGRGINLKKVFLEPRDFDLVMAIQGTGVEPFLEEGLLSTPEAWNRLTQVFEGQFFGFAVWFN